CSLHFRCHVVMQGVLGVGGNYSEWPVSALGRAAGLIAQYNRIRTLVQFGRQYWLRRPEPIGTCGVQYVSSDRTAFAILLYQVRGLRGRGARRMRLHGLSAERRYVRESDGCESTGATLMASGIPAVLVASGERRPSLDWQSELQIWRAI